MSDPLFDAVMSLDEAASHVGDARLRLGNAMRRVGLEEAGAKPQGAVLWANDDALNALRLGREALAAARFAISEHAAREAAK